MSHMKDLALTVQQKKEVLDRILLIWCHHPEQRLTQLLINATYVPGIKDNYAVEDFELVRQLEKYAP